MIDTTCSRHDVEGFLASADSGYVLCWAKLDIVKASDNLPVDKGLCVVTCGALQCPSLFHLERHGWSWFCYRPVVPFLSHHFWLMTDSQMANKSVKDLLVWTLVTILKVASAEGGSLRLIVMDTPFLLQLHTLWTCELIKDSSSPAKGGLQLTETIIKWRHGRSLLRLHMTRLHMPWNWGNLLCWLASIDNVLFV